MTVKLYLGNELISGGGSGGDVSAQFIVDFLINGMNDWCEMSDHYGITGEVFGIVIGPDFDAYVGLETAADIANDADALQVVYGSEDAQAAVQQSQWAIDAGLLGVPPLPNNIGDPFLGGYYAGIIDTTQSNIRANDYYKTGLRYAVIVSPKSIEAPAGKKWKTDNSYGPSGVQTMWNGLGSTLAMVGAGAAYEAANYCNDQSYDNDGASQWYLGAMDEMELVYRNLKCSTESNYTSNTTGAEFPIDPWVQGVNQSSDPNGAAYTSGSPAQTSVALFKTGGAQALGVNGTTTYYWTSTEYSIAAAWSQIFSGSTDAGRQLSGLKTNTNRLVRPLRRLLL